MSCFVLSGKNIPITRFSAGRTYRSHGGTFRLPATTNASRSKTRKWNTTPPRDRSANNDTSALSAAAANRSWMSRKKAATMSSLRSNSVWSSVADIAWNATAKTSDFSPNRSPTSPNSTPLVEGESRTAASAVEMTSERTDLTSRSSSMSRLLMAPAFAARSGDEARYLSQMRPIASVLWASNWLTAVFPEELKLNAPRAGPVLPRAHAAVPISSWHSRRNVLVRQVHDERR